MTSPRKGNSSVGHQLEKLWLHYLGILKVLISWASCLGTAVNSVCYTETIRLLKACLYQVCSTINMSEMLLHHDSARPCTSMCPIEAIRESEWTVLLHLPYLLASHYQIFTCLVLWKAACKDTFMWMTRHYRMLCTSGFKGRRETFRCDIPVVFYKLITKYNCQSKHNKIYCIMFYNMFYNYIFRPFSLGHLQVVYTRPWE